MSADPYFAFVAGAYGVSALALLALGAWTFLGARTARRELERLEAERPRREAP